MRTRLFLILFVFASVAKASTVRIGVFNDLSVSSLVLTIERGNYSILLDSSKRMVADSNSVYKILLDGDSLSLRNIDRKLGKFKRIDFTGDSKGALKLKCLLPYKAAKIYADDFSFFVLSGQFKIRNTVELEKYVAAVVEAEGGPKQQIEYYKVQAIICRTYALSNLRRHEEDNFNLCDQVHCQVYRGNSSVNPDIADAALQTRNLVLVDKKSELITTAFHSNCGGETCNSEDVWGLQKPYLRSVKDTFCLKQRNAKWTRVLARQEWNNYLSQSCKPCSYDSSSLCCDFIQEQRKTYFEMGEVRLPVKTMRSDLKLKSSFFSVRPVNDSLVFTGRGYGHGVGLCQEGAIQMARDGLKYNYILHYYYQEVDIINLNQLHFFKE